MRVSLRPIAGLLPSLPGQAQISVLTVVDDWHKSLLLAKLHENGFGKSLRIGHESRELSRQAA